MKVKSLLVPTLLELMKAGAGRGYVPLSTSDLSEALGQSQQAASQHLLELERAGMIERRRAGMRLSVRLTQQGLDAVGSLYTELKSAVEGKEAALVFRGTLFQGFGEGGYYIGLDGYKRQFSKLLGFEPFPGTLNLRLESPLGVEQKKRLRVHDGLRIDGFENGTRTYGGATCYRAVVNGRHKAAVLVIDRTHYDDTVLELISPTNFREEAGLKDGDVVTVEVAL